MVPRVTVFHLTPPRRLPLIEQDGLRTRADLSTLLGPPGAFDEVAPGTYAHGKRVSAYLALDHARARVEEHGGGLVSYSVDPRKTLAAPTALRLAGDPQAYWDAAQPLHRWLDDPPEDLEVHQNVPVRAKYVRLHSPLLGEEELGSYAPVVAAVADEDRLSAKALMHLAVIASGGDFTSPEFLAGCALAWRDDPDPPELDRELREMDADKVASAALAEFGAASPPARETLREALEETRTWGEENGLQPGEAVLTRMSLVLTDLPARAA